jgi:hypothetical protein
MTDSPVGSATREVAFGVARRDGELLVVEDGDDPSRSEERFRLPGESVRPDEHGVDAIRRAFRLFLEVELCDVRKFASFEAVDDRGDGSGRGPVRISVYELSFVGHWPYRLDAFPVRDPVTGGNSDDDCRWVSPSAFTDGAATLSPAGVADAFGLGAEDGGSDERREGDGNDDRDGSDEGNRNDTRRIYSVQ